MSKELPYFQFEPAAYLSGDITICSHEAQGVYINLCCLYWQNDCKLGLSKALRRFKQGFIDELVEESVVKVVKDQLVINFLDEQRSALLERRERLSAAGRKGGQAKPKPSLSDAKATPKHLEEKRREEKRIDNTKAKPKDLESVISYMKDQKIAYPEDTAQSFIDHYEANGWMRGKSKVKDWKACVRTWKSMSKQQNKGSGQIAGGASGRVVSPKNRLI